MKVKEANYKKSSGLDSVRFWLQGHRFVKFMLDIFFYIILFPSYRIHNITEQKHSS